MITIYAVYENMESDLPDAYVLHEEVATEMLRGNDSGDFVMFQITVDEWMSLILGGKK